MPINGFHNAHNQYQRHICNDDLSSRTHYRFRTSDEAPVLLISASWQSLFDLSERSRLTEMLTCTMHAHRWFDGTLHRIRGGQILDVVPVPYSTHIAYFILVHIDSSNNKPRTYAIPLAYAQDEVARQIQAGLPRVLFAHIWSQDGYGVLYHALWNKDFCQALLYATVHSCHLQGEHGCIIAQPLPLIQRGAGKQPNDHGPNSATPFDRQPVASSEAEIEAEAEKIAHLQPRIVQARQRNISIAYDEHLFLKTFYPVDAGVHPELEIGFFLNQHTSFRHNPQITGSLIYTNHWDEPVTLAMMQKYVVNVNDGWTYTLQELATFFERVVSDCNLVYAVLVPRWSLARLPAQVLSPSTRDIIGSYLDIACLLGERTADMHCALCNESGGIHFSPEPFSNLIQREIYQDIQSRADRVFARLQESIQRIPGFIQHEAGVLLEQRQMYSTQLYTTFMRRIITASRIRYHGEYLLKHILYTGQDVVITGFGNYHYQNSVTANDTQKQSPLRDVATMLRSLHYAVGVAVETCLDSSIAHREQYRAVLDLWGHFWYHWVSVAFLQAYFEHTREMPFVSPDYAEVCNVLGCYMFERAMAELEYELDTNGDRVHIPLRGTLQLFR